MRAEYIPVLGAWIAMAIWVTISILINKKHHPKALFQLFMVEVWERFSFYGMRALLVLYLVSQATGPNAGFGMPEGKAYGLYAAFGGLVYLTPLIGGKLADQILGGKRAIILGSALMAAGQFLLSMSKGNTFLLLAGLSTIVVGNGFFKPNISTLIGKLYPAGDARRDFAFSLFYMGINVGALLSPLTCGAVGAINGRPAGFFVAGVFMIVGLLVFLWTMKSGTLGTLADAPTDTPKTGFRMTSVLAFAITLALIPAATGMMLRPEIMDVMLGISAVGMVGYLLWLSTRYEKAQRQRFWVICILFLFATTFWCFFELAGSAVSVFTEKNISKDFLGIKLTAESFQSFNSLFVVFLAQPFAAMWLALAKRGKEPSTPVKFGVGLMLLGSGFFLLKLGVPFAVAGMMPAIFMAGMYFLHTLGELSISPVGLSLMTKMAPAKMGAFLMGFWFLSSSLGYKIGGYISSATATVAGATLEQSMQLSVSVFTKVGLFAVGAGAVLLVIAPLVSRWMHMNEIVAERPVAKTAAELEDAQEADARS